MNILNGNEAFAALAAGQKIKCRLIHDDHDFQDIKQFTATVYFDPRYEFRIAIKFFKIGEMQVPEPVWEAPTKGTQCFVPSVLTEVLTKAFKWKNSDSDLALMKRGQVHLIQEYAETHALALIAISGGSIEVREEAASNDVEEKTSVENVEIAPVVESDTEIAVEEAEMNTAPTEDNDVEAKVQQAQYEYYQKLLGELLERASMAKTPAEANALYKYTMKWTEEQRKPLMDAIYARLVELNPPVEDSSISVRISKAMDLTELDALEIDVSTCDEFIQPKLMEMVNKRRAELDPFFNPLESAS